MRKKQASKMQIKNIADKLGLSVSTVSVVLNGRGDQVRISKETQKKVLNAAKEINYQPNIYARRLRQAANEEAPYVLALFWRRDNLNSRLGRFLEGIFQTIDLKELKIELVVQAYEPGNFMTYMDMLSSNRFSGAMICGLNEEEQKALEEREITIPIVFIGRDSQIYHSVLMDSYRTGEECAACMNLSGVKSAAFLGFEKTGRAERLMEAGFLFGCRSHDVVAKEEWNPRIEKSSYEIGYQTAKQMLSDMELPTAWLVADCRLATGIMAYCRDVGICVPKDLRIIFFENSPLLRYNRPALSSVDIPSQEMAKSALDILILAGESRMDIPIRRELLPIYQIRESSGLEQEENYK